MDSEGFMHTVLSRLKALVDKKCLSVISLEPDSTV